MKKVICTLLLLLVNYAHSAAPATHVVFAAMWLDANGIDDPETRKEFIVGTLFPDIRYLGTINRDETHETGITPEKIRQSKTPFLAGMRFHVFVDEQRLKFLKKYKMNLKEISKKTRELFLKTLEDEILWDESDWPQISAYLLHIYPEQLHFVDQNTAEIWHGKMITYFKQTPAEFIGDLAAREEGFLQADAKTIQKWAEIFPIYAKDPYFIEYTYALKKHLFSLF